MAKPQEILPPETIWTDEQWARMRLGHKSADMDDKWDVIVDGTLLEFRRSWTGHLIYRARMVRAGKGWKVERLEVEGSQESYRRASDEADRLLLEALMWQELLRENRPDLWERYSAQLRRDFKVDSSVSEGG